jgi:two-component system phosphate regulon sensor histidine kinase PhoR
MQAKKYLWTLYLIIATIAISIAVQVYFNFKNYQINKQQFINQVQISLDNATDNYFVELAKNRNPLFSRKFGRNPSFQKKRRLKKWLNGNIKNDSITISIKNKRFNKDSLSLFTKHIFKDSTKNRKVDGYFSNSSFSKDSNTINPFFEVLKDSNIDIKEIFITKTADSTNIKFFTGLKTIYFSMIKDSLDFNRLNLLFQKELHRKNITLAYQLNHYIDKQVITSNDSISFGKNAILAKAKSVYLNKCESIELLYPNQTKTYLKKGLIGILLSLLLATAIIASLFYLMNIIKKQKQIAEIKNDFISNITHEFKTPITTIGLAVDSIKNFNDSNNKVKSEEYIGITKVQLDKLHVMVEKILETSVLDSEQLLLKKEPTNIIDIIEKCIAKYKISTTKKINFINKIDEIVIDLDVFHFENVINNLMDNAVKYGGDEIEVEVEDDFNRVESIKEKIPKQVRNDIVIKISDNGNILKNQKERIFDKFYRIPKGNTHDVKGFGIGLYYAKKIIEKHGGSLNLLNDKNTIFEIRL